MCNLQQLAIDYSKALISYDKSTDMEDFVCVFEGKQTTASATDEYEGIPSDEIKKVKKAKANAKKKAKKVAKKEDQQQQPPNPSSSTPASSPQLTEADILKDPTSAIALLVEKVRLEAGDDGVAHILKMLRGTIQGGAPPPPPAATQSKPNAYTPPEAKPTVRFLCVKYGAKYEAEYVNNLVNGIKRNYSGDVTVNFVCHTDDPTDLLPEISIVPLPALPFACCKSGDKPAGWWYKARLFKKETESVGRNVYVDLDTVVTGDVKDLIEFKFPKDSASSPIMFATLSTCGLVNERRGGEGLNSSVMIWEGMEGVCDLFNDLDKEGGFTKVHKVIQKFDHWVEMKVGEAALTIGSIYPKLVVEYKSLVKGGEAVVPEDGSFGMVTFPLKPKPKERVCEKWIGRHWRGEGKA